MFIVIYIFINISQSESRNEICPFSKKNFESQIYKPFVPYHHTVKGK